MPRAVRFHWVTTDSFWVQLLLCYAPTRSPKLPRDPRMHEIPKRLHGLAALCDASHLPFGCSVNPNNEMFMQESFVKECVPNAVRTQALQILNTNYLSCVYCRMSCIRRTRFLTNLCPKKANRNEIHIRNSDEELRRGLARSSCGLSGTDEHSNFWSVKNGQEHSVTSTAQQSRGSGNGALPVCDDHQSRHRMHCPRFAISDGSGSFVHPDFHRWNRGIRPHFSGSMLGAVQDVAGCQALPFVRLFYGQPSQYLWADDRGEGGEQGDALMSLLFSLGQHAALQAVQRRLVEGERLFAFLDDVYVTTPSPDRVGPISRVLDAELYRHARICINGGKTQVWNSGGICPEFCDVLERLAQQVDPGARVWRRSVLPA